MAICFCIYVLVSISSIFLFMSLLADKQSTVWLNSPWTGGLLGITAFICGCASVNWWLAFWLSRTDEWTGTITALVSFALIAFGTLCLPAYVLGARLGNMIAIPGAAGIRVKVDCSKARAAEAKEEYEKAETLYRAELTGIPAEDDVVYLALGNMHRKLKRNSDAAASWEKALTGDLAAEQHLATALRLADLCLQELEQPQRAANALEGALEIHPHAAEAAPLRKRLAALQA